MSSERKYPSPLTLRLTPEERTLLQLNAAGLSISQYVRSRVFDASHPQRRTRNKHPIKDHQSLGRLLAQLGSSHIANNLNQLAKAVHSGSLPVCAETEAELKAAYNEIIWMRQALMSALGLESRENP